MKISVQPRAAEKKREPKRLRRAGMIPAVVYGKKTEPETIQINEAEFRAMLQKIPSGHLATTVFELADEKKKTRRVLVKDIQYHVTSYQILHLDFEVLEDDVKVRVNVPIECLGELECAGIKQGGVLRLVLRHIRVECLPKDMPLSFKVNVKDLKIGQVKRLRDLKIADKVRPLVNLDEVALVIAKR